MKQITYGYNKMLAKFSIIVIAIFLIAACDGEFAFFKEEDMSSKIITLQLGESGDTLVKRLALDERKNIDHQPVGVNFYNQRFKSGELPTLRLDHGRYTFEIPNALRYKAAEAVKRKERGVEKLWVTWLFRNKTGAAIAHTEARLTMTAFLKRLTDLGWRNMISYSEPRLTGDESYRYRESDVIYPPDPAYLPDMDTWMKLDSGRIWRLYADGVIIEVGFHRNSEYMDPAGNGEHLLLLDAYPVESYAQAHFEYEVKEQWQELWVDEIKRLKRIRYQKETELIKQGYHIDTSYQDPLIHPADPVEPDMTDTSE